MTEYLNKIINADVREGLKLIPDSCVQLAVTSPPYYNLRDYNEPGQIGMEEDYRDYIKNLVDVFREVKRTLTDTGLLYVNIGDSYVRQGGPCNEQSMRRNNSSNDDYVHRAQGGGKSQKVPSGLKSKDLYAIPWTLAIALRSDGWYLRQDIIFYKKDPMPESVTSRCTKSHEYIFMLAKSEEYFYDHIAVMEPSVDANSYKPRTPRNPDQHDGDKLYATRVGSHCNGKVYPMRNKRSVWQVSTKTVKGIGHFATYPPELIEPCILAGTSEKGCCPICRTPIERIIDHPGNPGGILGHPGVPNSQNKDGSPGIHLTERGTRMEEGHNPTQYYKGETVGWEYKCDCGITDLDKAIPCIVLDPFMGSGTTGVVAKQHRRDYIGIELNPEYVKVAEKRIKNKSTDLF